MTARCKDCKSTDIVWDAWVDYDGNVVEAFDFCQCHYCGSEDIEHDVGQEDAQGEVIVI